MRGTVGLLVAALLAGVHPSQAGPANPPRISVGGTYQTQVTLESSTCPGQGVETHPTVVAHVPGDTTLSLTHAGSTYRGTLSADGSFSTPAVTQDFGGTSYTISLAGKFSRTGIDALVTVDAGVEPPCGFTARWAGPKDGAANVIP